MLAFMRSRVAHAIARRRGLLALVATLAFPALGDDRITEVRAVAVSVPPFVMETGGQLTGFSIDLWNEVAARLQLKTRYRVVPDIVALASALRTNEAHVVVAPIAYTVERDREFDFSYPILSTGQMVMVRGTGQGAPERPLRPFLRVLFSGSMIYWLSAALILIVLPAHVIWLADRRSPDGVSPSEKYFPGIFYAMAWTAEAMVSQAQQMPRQRVARLFGILWLYIGIVFVAFLTANLTANLTVERIRGAIDGPKDLPGKEVATIVGSPSAAYLRDLGAHVHEFNSPDEMYTALLSRQVDAVALGAPALQYYAAHDGLGKVMMVGPEFKKGSFGFVLPLNSPLRKKIDSALVALQEDGSYQRIYEKWFGGE
jgi:polar amino acid transport system substrate-binding protein